MQRYLRVGLDTAIQVESVQFQYRQVCRIMDAILEMGLCQQQLDAAILYQIVQAFTWIVGIERYIGTSRFEDGKQADNHFNGTFYRYADLYFRLHAQPGKPIGQPVRSRVQ